MFTTSGFAYADLNRRWGVMLAWVIGGIIAICGALSYGGLARRVRGSGGEYLFLSRTIHPIAGTMAGWISLLAGFTGAIAYAAITFETYVSVELPPFVQGLPPGSVAVFAIVACALAHSFAVRPGILAQNALIGFKLIMLFGFVAYALMHGTTDGWAGWQIEESQPSGVSLGSLALSLVWISLSFSGFNAAVYIAGEVSHPEQTVPQSLWLGTLITFVAYLALNFVFVYAPQPDVIRGVADIAGVAANAIGGQTTERLLRIVIVVSLFSSVSSMVIAGPRVYAQMAADGTLPQWLRMYQRRPVAAVWLQAVIAAVVALRVEFQSLLTYLGLTLSLSAAATACSLFVIHWREGRQAIQVLGYPFTPLVYVIATIGLGLLSASQRPYDFLAMVATLAIGGIAYGIQSRLRTLRP